MSEQAPAQTTADGDRVSVQRLIAAPPERIFDLLADPARHSEIDGSGTVVKPRSSRGERRLGLGDSFGMEMNWNVAYSTKNVVTEFEENRRIAWRTSLVIGTPSARATRSSQALSSLSRLMRVRTRARSCDIDDRKMISHGEMARRSDARMPA